MGCGRRRTGWRTGMPHLCSAADRHRWWRPRRSADEGGTPVDGGRPDAALHASEDGGVHSAVLRTHEELESLRGEWQQLYAACPTATPFLAHAWVAAWARAYCPAGSLRVVVVRSSGRLVAAVPLCLVRRRGWPALVPLGAGISDYTDILLAENSTAVRAAVTAALLAEPGWRLLELPELRPDAVALDWTVEWPGRTTRLPAATSLELPGVPLDALLQRLPSRTASVIRRKLRRSDALGIATAQVPAERTAEAIAEMLRLHEEQWRGRGINAEHLTVRFREHLTRAVPQLVADGQAVVLEHRLDGALVASQVGLLGQDLLGYYLAGISPGLKEQIDVASLLIRADVELTVAHGFSRYSLMRGEEDYKLRWRPERIEHTRLICARPGVLGAAGYPTMLRVKRDVERCLRAARGLARSSALVATLRSLRGRATAR